MKTYALIGKSLSHSFSEKYFTDKFREENILNTLYNNLEIDDISGIKEKIIKHKLLGFNVTIPYKSSITSYLDSLGKDAEKIGSVNTVKVLNGNLHGYNTDVIGFEKSILPLIKKRKTALILGNGGVSKSIQFVLRQLNIKFKIVSRNSNLDYHNITEKLIKESDIIINTTPLGTHPNTNSFPKIPYKYLNSKHLLYDVVYNPEVSQFLKYGKEYGAEIKNGLEMLKIQADESWKIWNSDII